MRIAGTLALAMTALLGLAITDRAEATTVNIDATAWGCTTCYGGPPSLGHVGATVTLVNNGKSGPLQLTLGPGTYRITNAWPSPGDYSAWRYDGGASDWAWNYVIASDNGNNTANVVKVGYMTRASGGLTSPGAWESATDLDSYYWDNGAHLVSTGISEADYYDTFTLSAATTLDFFVVDGYMNDNAGGVSLNITRTPIPATLPLFGTAVAGLAFAARRRTRNAAAGDRPRSEARVGFSRGRQPA
jgi:hypothetical protein